MNNVFIILNNVFIFSINKCLYGHAYINVSNLGVRRCENGETKLLD